MFNWSKPFSITILGSAGDLAKAVLAILNQSAQDKNDPLHDMIIKSRLQLIDIKQKEPDYYHTLFPNLKDKIKLYQLT